MRRIALIPLLALGLALASPASAQLTDNRGLYDRIDRLERDIQTLQAQLARGGNPGTTVVTSPALSAGSTPMSSGAPMSAARTSQLDERVDQLEDLVRDITGKLEEANYKTLQTQKQLERMQADIDLRFKELQTVGGAPAPAAQPGLSMPAASGSALPVPPKNGADGPGLAPGPQVLGVLTGAEAKRLNAEPPPGQAPVLTPPASVVPPKDAVAIYDDAYAKVQSGDYAGAEAGFKAFLAGNPKHQRAISAEYWLADLMFVRQDYKNSAAAFLETYKKDPKSTKAPDMLWKVAQSFARLDPPDKTDACKALALLFAQHPNMSDNVRRGATQDKQKLGCP